MVAIMAKQSMGKKSRLYTLLAAAFVAPLSLGLPSFAQTNPQTGGGTTNGTPAATVNGQANGGTTSGTTAANAQANEETSNGASTPTVNAQARGWTITPSVNLSETYTDNVKLQPAGQATSAFITEVAPGIDITAATRRLKLDLDYAVQNLHYSGDDLGNERTNQQLNAKSKLDLIDNFFYIDGTANISQQNQTPFGPDTTNNLNLSDNRVTIRTYSLSPYLHETFQQTATGELRYSRDSVATSLSGLTNSTADTIQASLKSGSAFKAFNWDFESSDQKIHYTDESDIEMQSNILNFGYHFSSQFELTGDAGYEKNNYVALNSEAPAGTTWSGGFAWTPSDRTNVAASVGKHYYGNSYMFSLNQRTRATVWTLGYNESITTTRSQYLLPVTTNTSALLNSLWQASIPDAAQRQQAVNAFIQENGLPSALNSSVNTLANQVFLQKSLLGSVAITGAQNTVMLNLFNIQRDAQSVSIVDDTGLLGNTNQALLNNTRQTGANALWSVKFGPRTDASIMTGYTRAVSNSTGITYNNKSTTLTFSHQLQPKLKAMLELMRLQNDSNVSTGDFKENAISVFLLLGF
ncbi:TIGR03016 family PEP-CTERM system-associated outer membrane protein [Solimicrobium silvestre]|uniref:Uncharacterized protein, PEP-CTERM system associated n=1 Tax=Solimicrobium silvestre TaxID=2099400 RepID=A0A2S9H0Q7_9BURK|nr:TIGR03016 family PEP-CTERM system-associated outer membrane protein [Solimicrobium silvestre]PRC93530.1 Uncharacterized protein, PEP-CTERM system associated [Solimicrobium silvestre]